MHKHPARHFIYFLISKRLSAVQIVSRLRELRLHTPQLDWALEEFVKGILEVRRKMTFPETFDPLAEKVSASTVAYLGKWKIKDAWEGGDHFRAAANLCTVTQVRRFVEVLLLGPLALTDIARRAIEFFNLNPKAMNVGVLRAYTHYFWDISAMEPAEWEQFLKMTSDDPARRISLRAPRNSAGALLSLQAAGVEGSLSSAAIFATTRDSFFRMFMEHTMEKESSLFRTHGAFFALQGLVLSDEKLREAQGGDTELLAELNRIETTHDRKRLKSMGEIRQLPAIIEAEVIETTVIAEEGEPQ